MKYIQFLGISLFLSLLVVSACSDANDPDMEIADSNKEIKSFTLAGIAAIINKESKTIEINMDVSTIVSDIAPELVISEGATIFPQSGTKRSFLNPVTYTITAADGSKDIYTASVNKGLRTENDILSFTINDGITNINGTHITIIVPYKSDPSQLIPSAKLSEQASIYPATGIATDFSTTKSYLITAENGNVKSYTVQVIVALSPHKNILSFKVDNQLTSRPTEIDSTRYHTVRVIMPLGYNLSQIKPYIEVSNKATISPQSEDIIDFSKGAVDYLVTAEDGTIQTYKVSVEAARSENNFVESFSFQGSVSTQIYHDRGMIDITVPSDMDVSKVRPLVNVSSKAKIVPASGEEVDLTSPFEYKVYAESDSVRIYTVRTWRQ